jgi:hypothetical protein
MCKTLQRGLAEGWKLAADKAEVEVNHGVLMGKLSMTPHTNKKRRRLLQKQYHASFSPA